MTTQEQQAKLQSIVDDLAHDFALVVNETEARIATTKGHYGDYLTLIGHVAKDQGTARVVALALVQAGASREGVAAALHILYP